MTKEEQAKYAGKLLGQMEAHASESEKTKVIIIKAAQRLLDLNRGIQWNEEQININCPDAVTKDDIIWMGSMRRTLDHTITNYSDPILK